MLIHGSILQVFGDSDLVLDLSSLLMAGWSLNTHLECYILMGPIDALEIA